MKTGSVARRYNNYLETAQYPVQVQPLNLKEASFTTPTLNNAIGTKYKSVLKPLEECHFCRSISYDCIPTRGQGNTIQRIIDLPDIYTHCSGLWHQQLRSEHHAHSWEHCNTMKLVMYYSVYGVTSWIYMNHLVELSMKKLEKPNKQFSCNINMFTAMSELMHTQTYPSYCDPFSKCKNT